MSSLFVFTNQDGLAPVAAELHRFNAATWGKTGVCGPHQFSVTRVDEPKWFGPASDPKTGVHVLIGGRPAFEDSDWERAESLPYEGGLAGRLIIDAWKRHPDRVHKSLNGMFGAVILVPNSDSIIVTDRLGIFPFYSLGGFIGSHPDVLASCAEKIGKGPSLNKATLAEQLATGQATHPYTLYEGITQLEPASIYRLTTAGKLSEAKSYWEPSFAALDSPTSDAEIVDELSNAFKKSVARRTHPRFGKSLLLLSGGADSRCVLFGAHTPSAMHCVTLCDEPNAEVETAANLARCAGASHQVIRRPLEYYFENSNESMRVIGGMWNLIDAHYTGAYNEIQKNEPGVSLTGCYADYIFKGVMLNRTEKKMFGRCLPVYRLDNYHPQYYQDRYALSDEYAPQLESRILGRFPETLTRNYPEKILEIENRRLRPLSREADTGGRMWSLRCTPWDPFLADNDVVAAWEKMSIEQRINGIVFGKAVSKVCGSKAAKIFNNNYRTPVGASETKRVAYFLAGSAMRKFSRFTKPNNLPKHATTGSWPAWPELIKLSGFLKDFWANVNSTERDLYQELLRRDPFQDDVETCSKSPLLLLRCVTSLTWLRQRDFV